jgi:CRP/FNR family transcriptional regulator
MTEPSRHVAFPACALCDLRPLCRPVQHGAEVLPAARILRHRRTLRRGGYVFRMGEPCHSLCAICSGSTRTSVLSADGGAQVTGFQFCGDLLGMGALGTHEHHCDAVALEPTVVCEISFVRLEEIAEHVPAVQHTLIRLMSDELAHSQDMLLTFLGQKSASVRLANYLGTVARRLERRGLRPEEVCLSMSRSDIGNYLGLAKETVSRLFTRFAHDGLVRSQARRFWVTDTARLAELTDSQDAPV